MKIDKLTVTILFDHDDRPQVVHDLFSHITDWDHRVDNYAVPFVSWNDIGRRLDILEGLAKSVAAAIRFADEGIGPGEANFSCMDMVDIEAYLDEITPEWRNE